MPYFIYAKIRFPNLCAVWTSITSLLLLGLALQLPSANAQAIQQFPYVAYVIESEAFARSGPGGRHYTTSALSEGFAVEVFRHDGDNWCAIRPPVGSFSWVEAHKLRIVGDGTAEILDDQTVARVGSLLTPDRSAVQVMLQRGELVKLAASPNTTDRRWLAITAPAGEFRWIAARKLSRRPPLENSQTPNASILNRHVPSPQAQWQARHGIKAKQSVDTVSSGQQRVGSEATESFSHLLQSTSETKSTSRSVDSSRDVESIDVIAGSPAEAELAQYQSNNSPLPPPGLYGKNSNAAAAQNNLAVPPMSSRLLQQSPPVQGSVATGASAITMPANISNVAGPPRVRFRDSSANTQNQTARLDELQLRLSQTILNQPELWQFDTLRREADVLLNQAVSTSERTRMRDFQDQITRFELIRSRRLNPRNMQPNNLLAQSSDEAIDATRIDPFDGELTSDFKIDPRNQSARQRALADLSNKDSATGSDTRSRDVALDDTPNEVRYDAVGLLKPVVSRRNKAPQYALVDDKGEVVSFITPTPDVNLQPHVGKRIGIQGTRGFMPEYRRAHVTASRVTPLEERRLR